MTESFTKSDNKQKSVVLLEYPRKGVWAVGFATKENEGMIKNKIKEEIINCNFYINHSFYYIFKL